MGLFRWGADPRDGLISTLRAELSDIREASRRDREQWAAERQSLVDQLIALANPLALRELKRTTPGEPQAPAKPRTHYPGGDLRIAPPPPPAKPTVPPLPDEAA